MTKEAIDHKIGENSELASKIIFYEKRIDDLKDQINNKLEEVNQATDSLNEKQYKFFDTQQKLDDLRQRSEKEISNLQTLLKASNEQNKLKFQEKQYKEEDYK